MLSVTHIIPVLVLNTCMDANMQLTINSFRQLFADKTVFAVIEQQQQQRSCWCFSTWINTWRNIILASRRLAVSVDGVWKLRQTVDVAIQLHDKVARTPNVCHKSRLRVIWTHNNSNTHIRTREVRNRFFLFWFRLWKNLALVRNEFGLVRFSLNNSSSVQIL